MALTRQWKYRFGKRYANGAQFPASPLPARATQLLARLASLRDKLANHLRKRHTVPLPVNLFEELYRLGVNQSVVSQDMWTAYGERFAMHVCRNAAGFPHQQNSGGNVPGIQAELPKHIQPPAGDVSQVQSRRSRAPHAMRQHGELIVEVHIDVLVTLPRRKARRHQRILNPRGLRYVNTA